MVVTHSISKVSKQTPVRRVSNVEATASNYTEEKAEGWSLTGNNIKKGE